jgi:phosphoribosylformylglycinamidine synthase subunit PurS
MRVTVLVRPKDGILDPQGEAIRRSLGGLGYRCDAVRAGKLFDLEVEAEERGRALELAGEIAERLLANPLIEQFELEARE